MAVCPKCGSESDGQFCINCGASMNASAQSFSNQTQTVIVPEENVPNQTQTVIAPAQNYQNPSPNYQNVPPRYQNPVPNYQNQTPPPVYNNVSVVQPRNVTSPGGWIGWMILMTLLPFISIIIMLCCSSDESVKNFAKAQLYIILFSILLVVLGFLAVLIIGAIGASSM